MAAVVGRWSVTQVLKYFTIVLPSYLTVAWSYDLKA